MAKGRIVQIQPLTQTTRALNSRFPDEMFVPDWDKEPGAGQQLVRTRKRAAMGRKMTPIGNGVMTKSRS